MPKWYGNGGGPTFGPTSQVQKRAKVGSKKAKKFNKRMAKATQKNAFGDTQFALDFEQACGNEAMASVGKVARDRSLPRGERMAALYKLDACALRSAGLDPTSGKGGLVAKMRKSEKKGAKELRERYEYLALNAPDVATRARAQDILFGEMR